MSTTVLPACVCCGHSFFPEEGDYDPNTNLGTCKGCENILPLTGKTVLSIFAGLDQVPQIRQRHMFKAKRLRPNGVAIRASDERKLSTARRAQLHEALYGIKTPWTTRRLTTDGGILKPQRREFRDRRDYLTALDLRRPEEITLGQPTPTSDSSSGESGFWTFGNTPANDRNLSPVEFALVRFLDTKAPGLNLDTFVDYFDGRRSTLPDETDPIAELNELGDMEELSSFGEATPSCMRFYASIDEQALDVSPLAASLK